MLSKNTFFLLKFWKIYNKFFLFFKNIRLEGFHRIVDEISNGGNFLRHDGLCSRCNCTFLQKKTFFGLIYKFLSNCQYLCIRIPKSITRHVILIMTLKIKVFVQLTNC
jgi:hypothetical protein